MGMAFSLQQFLVVVDQFSVKRIGSLEAENDAPVGSYCHRPEPFQVPFKSVQPVTGKVKCLRRVRLIEAGKNILNRVQQVGSYLAAVTTFVEPFQTPMLEAPNQQDTT